MLKDILVKCANILGRDDIVSVLNSTDNLDSVEDTRLQADISKLISYLNFTVNTICEHYLELTDIDKVKSNSEGKIFYHNFHHYPIKIIQVKDEKKFPTVYQVFTNFIVTDRPNRLFYVSYRYVPKLVLKLDEDITLPLKINENVICYGVVSEFLASKRKYNQSVYWKDRFMLEVYKLKVYRERRLKSTFCR